MVSVSVCPECKGKGKYKIYNAYDPDFEEETICEYCDGDGVLSDLELVPKRRDSRQDDDWLN